MWRIVARRIALAVPLLVAVAALNFTLMSLVPGDPVLLLFGEGGSPDAATLAALRSRLALHQPVPQRFLAYLSELAHGHLGQSIVQGRPVTSAIAERLPASLLLAGAAFVLAAVLGVGLGLLLTRLAQRSPRLERFAFLALLLSGNQPPFVAGLVLLVVFALVLGILPSQGMTSARGGGSSDLLAHLALPALTLALQPMFGVARVTRARLLDVWLRDHVRTARAIGNPEWRILWRHVLRNALTAPITLLALTAAHWAGGAVLTETVFAWPGIGRLAVDATLARDYPMILGVILTGTLLVVVANLVADILLAAVDPRIRHE
ncbi:MAG: ABC transporter permease [Gemmatimonadota bacterium]|nr:ABC transporter permease [Gemmatimonadota bacterium]